MKTGRILALSLALVGLALASAACNKAGKSPTGTAQAFLNAAKNKDVAGMKNALSKKTLQVMEQAAKADNKSLDDWIKEKNEKDPPKGTSIEARDEKINGDLGTVEIKDENGNWRTFHFVKEDGLWKMDLLATMGGAPDTGGGGDEGGGHGGH
jgi:flagellar hook-associated protein FlgK